MSRLTLALDVMGGDIGPRITMPAAIQAIEKDPHLSLLLFGDRQQISPYLAKLPYSLSKRLTVCHAPKNIPNDANIAQAVRHSKNTSMRLALEAVQEGIAQGCVSGGNTGALMGLATILIKPLAGISRPALVSFIPTLKGKQQVMLDLGANIECNAQNLYEFALMGTIFAQEYLSLVFPRIALLNIGTEAQKGTQVIRDSALLIQQNNQLNYIGFIESNQLLHGKADVIVQDGFVGNIALKTLEGALLSMQMLLQQGNAPKNGIIPTIKRGLENLFKPYFRQILKQKLQPLNPEKFNGASLLGLQAVVVKSHGSANTSAFANAIANAAKQVRLQMPTKIAQGLNASQKHTKMPTF